MTTLYKFIGNPDDAQFLLEGRVKFTPIKELNDPTELQPSVLPDDVQESLIRLRERGYTSDDMAYLRQQGALLQRLAPAFQAIQVPATREQATAVVRSSFYDNLPLLIRLLSQTAEQISSQVGLLCLTKRNDSLPMWVHYAANATGLVIQFQDLHNVFRGDETGILHQPISVCYERDRMGVTFDPKSHETLFFSKFADWSYEEEVRVVLPLSDCRQEMIGSRAVYLFDIPKRHIARILLGWRVAPRIADKVIHLIRSTNATVEVAQMRIERGQLSDRSIYP